MLFFLAVARHFRSKSVIFMIWRYLPYFIDSRESWPKCRYCFKIFDRNRSILIEFLSFYRQNARFCLFFDEKSTIFHKNDRNLAKFLYFLNDFFEILMIYRHICAFSRLLMSLRNQQFYRNMSLFETISLDFRQF